MALAAAHRHHADPDILSAQSDLIGAPEPMSIEAVLAAPNGGYLRVRWREWWLRCDDPGRGRLGRTARASALAWLGRPQASAADLTSRAGRLRCHSRSALPGDIVPRRNRQAPAATSAITSTTTITGPKVGMGHKASAARLIRCQMHPWTRQRPRPPPPTATLAPAGAGRRTFALPRGHLTRCARFLGNAPSRRSRSSGDDVLFRSAVSSARSPGGHRPARPASARRADRPG